MTFFEIFFSNFCSHIKDSKWGRKCIFINCSSCNGSLQKIPFQFANGKLPHSRCKAFWAMTASQISRYYTNTLKNELCNKLWEFSPHWTVPKMHMHSIWYQTKRAHYIKVFIHWEQWGLHRPTTCQCNLNFEILPHLATLTPELMKPLCFVGIF